MEFHTSGEAEIAFRNIHPLLAGLIRSIPDALSHEELSSAAEARLYPAPTSDPDLDDLRDDWNAFVTPGLQSHFQSARDIVGADLRRFTATEDDAELTIPFKHADAWLNVLNQARLALAASVSFDEEALESGEMPDLLTERGVVIFRINLYAFMQQCLIDRLDRSE